MSTILATSDHYPILANARIVTRDQLLATFIPTDAFWQLLSVGHHIVLGSRGSGKTALAKMLSHEYLSRWDNPRAKELTTSKAFIGIYVPTRLSWVGALKNKPWQDEIEMETYFQWRVNLAACLAMISTLKSCLNQYITDPAQRVSCDFELASDLSGAWCDESKEFKSLSSLERYLEDLDYRKQQQSARMRAQNIYLSRGGDLGPSFNLGLFEPLKRGITLAIRKLDLPKESKWLLCLDEAEFLTESHHRILNSLMRADSGNLYMKITTMPYFHHTLQTNTDVHLIPGNDFSYVYIDQDPVVLEGSRGEEGISFANKMFNNLTRVFNRGEEGLNLQSLLGSSPLLDRKTKSDWGPQSENMKLLKKYATNETIARAYRLSKHSTQFSDQIARKIHGALLLRNAITLTTGRKKLDVYSGVAMAVRCGDANPRKLIRIFNLLLQTVLKGKAKKNQVPLIPADEQTSLLIAVSTSTLTSVQSENEVGPEMFNFIVSIGNYMKMMMYDENLTTDQITSITVDPEMFNKIDSLYWLLIKRAVGVGLLYPNINANNPDPLPHLDGKFHLAYILAPHFKLLPRRGHSRKLSAIIKWANSKNVNNNSEIK